MSRSPEAPAVGPIREVQRSGVAGEPWRRPFHEAVDASGYDDFIRELLHIVVEYSVREDAEAIVGVIRDARPVIEFSGALPADGTMEAPFGDQKDYIVKLRRGYLLVPGPSSGEPVWLRDAPAYYTSWYGELPRVEPLRSGSRPARFDREQGMHAQYFADGSKRLQWGRTDLALSLMHELMHVDTHRRGGGVHVESHEWRSYSAEFRTLLSMDRRNGAPVDVAQAVRRLLEKWRSDPRRFRAEMHVSVKSESVEKKRAETLALLALPDAALQEYMVDHAFWAYRVVDGVFQREREAELLLREGMLSAQAGRVAEDSHARAEDAIARKVSTAEFGKYREQLRDKLRRLDRDEALDRETNALNRVALSGAPRG